MLNVFRTYCPDQGSISKKQGLSLCRTPKILGKGRKKHKKTRKIGKQKKPGNQKKQGLEGQGLEGVSPEGAHQVCWKSGIFPG